MTKPKGSDRKTAVALRYDPLQEPAPKVMAKGVGPIAEKIMEIARENGIPIQEDRDLVALLAELDLQEEIPADLYQVVAELLAFVYRTGKKR